MTNGGLLVVMQTWETSVDIPVIFSNDSRQISIILLIIWLMKIQRNEKRGRNFHLRGKIGLSFPDHKNGENTTMDVFFFNFRGKKKQKMIKGKHRHAHAHTHNPDTPNKDNDSPYLHENIKQCRKAGLTVPLNSSCICHRNTYLSTQDQFCNQAWLWKKLFCMSKILGNGHFLIHGSFGHYVMLTTSWDSSPVMISYCPVLSHSGASRIYLCIQSYLPLC